MVGSNSYQVIDDGPGTVDGIALCDEIVLDHAFKCFTFSIFRMAPTEHPIWREIRFPAQPDDPLRQLVHMALPFFRMLKNFFFTLSELIRWAMK